MSRDQVTPRQEEVIRKAFKEKDWNEIKTADSWVIFKVMSEFVNGFEKPHFNAIFQFYRHIRGVRPSVYTRNLVKSYACLLTPRNRSCIGSITHLNCIRSDIEYKNLILIRFCL